MAIARRVAHRLGVHCEARALAIRVAGYNLCVPCYRMRRMCAVLQDSVKAHIDHVFEGFVPLDTICVLTYELFAPRVRAVSLPYASSASIAACLICGEDAGEVLLEIANVPINCSALFHSPADAVAAPIGSLRLVLCPSCGYVCNQAFDPGALTYDAAYENALDFSPSFCEYLDGLAVELIQRHELRGRTAVEFGCGQGSFLAALCAGGCDRGYGFDPGFRGDLDLSSSIEIASEMFDPAVGVVGGALYCGRHVLEHVPNPLEFVRGLRPVVARDSATLYLEVPAAEAVFGGDASFDLNYPHVSYFSAPALAVLLDRAGFTVDRIERRFGGQFLSAEARATGERQPHESPPRTSDSSVATNITEQASLEAIARFADQARGAAAELERRLGAARARVDDAQSRGYEIALWGAGAKAVTFLALLERQVDTIVDISPRKRGSYMPGSGLAVDSREALATRCPELVFILNPMYRDEITAMLTADSIASEVVIV